MKKRKHSRRPPRTPHFVYVSQCCNARAEKTPCVREPEDIKAGDWSQSTLGTWRCSQCNRPCKCSRHKQQPKEEATNAV